MPRKPSSHKPAVRVHQADRQSAARRGYGRRWQKVRTSFLADHPSCAHCGEPARHVDHVTPKHHGVDGADCPESGMQALCARCHGRKTRSERGARG